MSSGVIESSNEEEPIDAKESKRQRSRERYAQMYKKDELLKKRRETYQQKMIMNVYVFTDA
jgi:hypothetical protein